MYGVACTRLNTSVMKVSLMSEDAVADNKARDNANKIATIITIIMIILIHVNHASGLVRPTGRLRFMFMSVILDVGMGTIYRP